MKEIVDDMFLVIQNIIAGTANVSSSMLNETCLEYKVQLTANSPVITLLYELEPDNIECVPALPIFVYDEFDENSGNCDDNGKSTCDIYDPRYHDIKETSLPDHKVKQEIPELLSVLDSTEERKDEQFVSFDSLQQGKIQYVNPQVSMCTKLTPNSTLNLDENFGSSTGREPIPLSVCDSDIVMSPTERFQQHHEEIMNKNENNKLTEVTVFPEKVSSCTLCEKLFVTESEKINHLCDKSFSKSNVVPERKKNKRRDKLVSCSECGKCFTRTSNLTMHKRIHTGEKPFTCQDCGKSFIRLSYLVQHQRIHTGDKPFMCRDCNKSFIRLDSLVRHQRTHTGEKSFICEYCGKCFIQSGQLSLHKRTHTGDKDFTCGECGKSFFRVDSLLRHERVHAGEKPFTCKDCGKFFTSSSVLYKHKRIHTQEALNA